MNILLVSAYFYPDITPRSFRTTELLKEFVKRGHKVVLYIPFRDYDYSQFQNEYPCEIKFLTKKGLNPVLPQGSNIIKRGIRFLFYQYAKLVEYPYIKLLRDIPRTLQEEDRCYDLLISIAAPHAVHWACSKVVKDMEICKTWIADCGDPFMGDQTSKHPFYFKYLERRFCNKADFITIPIEAARTAYYPEFRNKIHIIPQGFDFSIFKNIEMNYHGNKVPTFAYAGALYPGYRDLTSFVDYISQKDIDFLFVLYSPSGVLVNKYKKKLGDRMLLKPFLPREELLEELSSMDFLINIENRGTVQAPSKLIDYVLTKRPILSVPFDINYDTIDEFFNGDYSNRLEIDDISRYDIVKVVDSFLDLKKAIGYTK